RHVRHARRDAGRAPRAAGARRGHDRVPPLRRRGAHQRSAHPAASVRQSPGSMTTETSPDSDDAALVARLRGGDAPAYEELVRRETPRLLRVARRFLQSEEDARDSVQDAFISAFRSIADFESGARLSTWLHRIVINAALMKLRSRRRKPEEDIEKYLPR